MYLDSLKSRKLLSYTFALFTTFVVIGCTEKTNNSSSLSDEKAQAVSTDGIRATKLFRNGSIYTMNEAQPWAEVVAIVDDEIVYVGDEIGATDILSDDTEIVDLDGRMLLPGFIDTHAHPISGGAYAKALELDTYSGPDVWLDQIKQYAIAHPDEEMIFGYGFLASSFGLQGPTRQMIDSVESDRPVFIIDEGLHTGWANTKAIEALGIDQNTPDPRPGFSYYKREDDGYPTGYFLEGTAFQALRDFEIESEANVVNGLSYLMSIMHGYGLTAVFDASASDTAQSVRILKALDDTKQMLWRYKGSMFLEGYENLQASLDSLEQFRADSMFERANINTLKVMMDGTIEGRTAAVYDEYIGDPGNKGAALYTQTQLDDIVLSATERGIDVHIHALGDRAVTMSLDAIEKSRLEFSDSDVRFTICHVQLLLDADVPRFKALDVMVQSTPLWASYDEFGSQFINADQYSRYFRFNSLSNAGARLTFGSDYPASGAGKLGLSPLYNMTIGMTRREAGEPESKVLQPESERLSLDAMLRGYTIDAAYQLRLEEQVGSIEVGKQADLVVLEKNLFDVAAEDIHLIKVDETLLGGVSVHRK